MDVKFYETFKEEEAAIRARLPARIKAEFQTLTIQESKDQALPAEIISIRTQSQIPTEWNKNLKGVFTRSHGFDHLTRHAKESKAGIVYGYLEPYCSRAVAEHAVLMMFMLLKKAKLQIKQFRQFDRSGITGTECQDKNALVVGVGCIGAQIVNMAKGLNMNVKGIDLVENLNNFEYVNIDEGLGWADVIFCAMSLTETSNKMLNYNCLKKAKPTAIFLNVSRGEISPLEDLRRLLNEAKLGGIGLDVFEEEGRLVEELRSGGPASSAIKAVHDLESRDNVIFTPHNAFNSGEALERKARLSVDAVVMFLAQGKFPACLED